jgi:hypothetical protein
VFGILGTSTEHNNLQAAVVELQNKPRQINARIRISDLMLDIVIEG